MREIKVRALAENHRVDADADKVIEWYYDVLYGDGGQVYLDTRHQGIKPLKDVIAISQYTGLKDKNGVEIYEGDIISSPESYYFEKDDKDWVGVIEENNYGGLVLKFKDHLSPNPLGEMMEPVNDPQTASFLIQSCEVIGNIYENPDLLKAQQ